MTRKTNMTIHELCLDGEEYRITEDVWTGDWLVERTDRNFIGQYFLTEEGAINYVMYNSGITDEQDYEYAPDRTSA